MVDEYDDKFKLNTLWREHEDKKHDDKKTDKPESAHLKPTMLFGRDIKDLIIWALLAATAGTNDNIQKLLGVLIK